MSPIRKLLLVTLGALALSSVQACSAGTELNPQPLPPQGPDDGTERTPTGAGSDKAADPNAAGGTSGGATPAPSQDAGAEGGDASDGGG